MTGLIQKSGYIRNGGSDAVGYMNYIATRDGVDLLTNDTERQESDKYMKYIAERPRSHGLFSGARPITMRSTTRIFT